MNTIDLNADVGEGVGAASVAADAALLALVSSANIRAARMRATNRRSAR